PRPVWTRICDRPPDTSRAVGVVTYGRPITARGGAMASDLYRYVFDEAVPGEEIETTLVLSIFAVEALHGESQTRLDAGHAFDGKRRRVVIDATTAVGRGVNRAFLGFVT